MRRVGDSDRYRTWLDSGLRHLGGLFCRLAEGAIEGAE